MVGLTAEQIESLKRHKYAREGISFLEPYMDHFWWKLAGNVPLWVTPNLLTLTGLVINIASTLLVIILDYNAQGNAPQWVYLWYAVSVFLYQTLDALDGKQCTRTDMDDYIAELFDHGCDAASIVLLAMAAISATGFNDHPYVALTIVLLMVETNYLYHWQTFVSGIFHFQRFDVTEGQFLLIAELLFTATFGVKGWYYPREASDDMLDDFSYGTGAWIALDALTMTLGGLTITLRVLFCGVMIVGSMLCFLRGLWILLTRGAGKGGRSVAGTNILSPMISQLLLILLALTYAAYSPGQMLHKQCMLFLLAFCLPITKTAQLLMISSMSKTAVPMLDYIMLGPVLALVNIGLNVVIPEHYVLIVMTIFNVMDISVFFTVACRQMCHRYGLSCFVVPSTQKKL